MAPSPGPAGSVFGQQATLEGQWPGPEEAKLTRRECQGPRALPAKPLRIPRVKLAGGEGGDPEGSPLRAGWDRRLRKSGGGRKKPSWAPLRAVRLPVQRGRPRRALQHKPPLLLCDTRCGGPPRPLRANPAEQQASKSKRAAAEMWFQLAPRGGPEIASGSRAGILQASASPKRVGSLLFTWLPGQRVHGKNGSLWRGGRLLTGRGGGPVHHSRPKKRLAEERLLPLCFALGSHFLDYPCRGTCSLQPSPSPKFPAGAATAQLPGNPAPLPGLLATRSLGRGLRGRPDESTRSRASCSLAVSGAEVQDASASP